MSDNTIRDELAAALRRGHWPSPDGIADALLPVVERYAAQRAAEALRDAADEDAQDHGTVDEDWAVSVDRLEARAAALAATGTEEEQ